MTNFAKNLKIENFKSIKSLELTCCKRINLFIGKPNVGKSNILEALSLFSLPFLMVDRDANMKTLVRAEQESELFMDGNTDGPIDVSLDKDNLTILNMEGFRIQISNQSLFYGYDMSFFLTRHQTGEIPKNNPYKTYLFPKSIKFDKAPFSFLLPPHGQNLFDVIQANAELKQEFLEIFREYGLYLVFDKGSQELKIMKGLEKGEIFLMPFSAIADSLQRLMFYKAAIVSNSNSILIFEEPEAHTYPIYISKIMQDVISSVTNQFFISTHSPYVVREFLDNGRQELAVFLVDFKNGETVVRHLTDDELTNVYQSGVDLFFNNELYT